jgi:phospholipid/cholesterol/gamma-HCH transport system substrate-binding protein
MPSPQRVAWAQLRVGVVAVVAMILLATMVFLVTGKTSFFEQKAALYTYLSDSAAMANGAEVRLNGIEIGKVQKVDLSGEGDPRRAVKVTMEISSERLKQIPTDSEAAIGAANVLGTKYINITRGKAADHIKPGGTITARDTSDFDDVVASGYNMIESTRGMLKRIDGLVSVIEQGKGSIGKLIFDEQLYKNLNATAGEARKITEQINTGKGSFSKLLYDDAVIEDVRRTFARVDHILDGLEQGQGTAGKFLKDPAVFDELRKTTAEFRTLAADLNAGKGTMGKLLKDEATIKKVNGTIDQVNGTIAKMDTMLAKLNSGQGTLGQLLVNQQLYESLNGTSKEMHDLMKDFRKNPKKFLSIKLGLF